MSEKQRRSGSGGAEGGEETGRRERSVHRHCWKHRRLSEAIGEKLCKWVRYLSAAHRGQKRTRDPLDMELWIAVDCQLNTGNQTGLSAKAVSAHNC